jgi:hypothetical protein
MTLNIRRLTYMSKELIDQILREIGLEKINADPEEIRRESMIEQEVISK